MSAGEIILNLAQDARTGTVTAASTVGTGLGTVLDLIPSDIGKLATLVGIVLSSLLIYAQFIRIQRERMGRERDRIQLEQLKAQIAQHEVEAHTRRRADDAARRRDDLTP